MTTPNTPLAWLIARLTRLIQASTDALETQYPAGVEAWQQELSRQIARYSAASFMTGAGDAALSGAGRTAVVTDLATQLRFLNKFAVEVQDGKEWQKGWNSRAAMYASSIQTPYWRAFTRMLPLPAMPGDGTTPCLVNCKCSWDLQELDGDENYDCYWRLGAVEHCQICRQRAINWAPLEIREGIVQL